MPPLLVWIWLLAAGLSFAAGVFVASQEPFDKLSMDAELAIFFGCWFLAIVFLVCALWAVITA
jgi:hypothetical protein